MLHQKVAPTETEADAHAAPLQTLLALRVEFLRFLSSKLASPAQAEDILQACYLKALEHPLPSKDAESSRAWFYRVLRNALIDNYRRKAMEGRAYDAWAAELELEVAPQDLAQAVVCHCISHVLPSLKPSYSAILQAVELDETHVTDYAQATGISPANANVRLHRARKALKQRLLETCGTCATHGCLDCTCKSH